MGGDLIATTVNQIGDHHSFPWQPIGVSLYWTFERACLGRKIDLPHLSGLREPIQSVVAVQTEWGSYDGIVIPRRFIRSLSFSRALDLSAVS